jgi:peptidoglycan/LPS O-acetylase OafA/YrhL
MSPSASLFLDAARFIAAMIVFLSHLTALQINAVFPWVRWGHEAVVIFFVISGYVIGYVAATRERHFTEYAAARLGRLYSVVVPALILTFVLDGIGMALEPGLYSQPDHEYPILRMLANLLFVQQAWNFTITALSNRPFWSLSFEFWYYLIFAAFLFAKGKVRVLFVLLALAGAGPRIVAFFPLWLMGLGVFHASEKWHPSAAAKRTGLIAAGTGLVMLLWLGSPLGGVRAAIRAAVPNEMLQVGGVSVYLGDIPRLPEDLLIGIVFCAMIWFAQGQLAGGAWKARVAAATRYLAGSTFSLYLFHVPLIYFFIAAFHISKDSLAGILATGAFTLATSVALSHLFERRVASYRLFFLNLFALLGGTRQSRAPQAVPPRYNGPHGPG